MNLSKDASSLKMGCGKGGPVNAGSSYYTPEKLS